MYNLCLIGSSDSCWWICFLTCCQAAFLTFKSQCNPCCDQSTCSYNLFLPFCLPWICCTWGRVLACCADWFFLLSLASTQLCLWHSAVPSHPKHSNLAQMKCFSSLLKAQAQCKTLNFIGRTLLILFWSLDGASGLAQLYFFGAGFTSIFAMQFLWVSLIQYH